MPDRGQRVITSAIAWLTTRLSSLLLIALLAALSLAGMQTIRLANTNTAYANHRAATERVNAKRAQDYAEDMNWARDRESWMADQADLTRKKSYEAITTLDDRVAALVERLRNERAARPVPGSGGAAPIASAAAGSTGAGLYADDGAFLIRFAAAAALTGIERDACRSQYQDARQALANHTKQP